MTASVICTYDSGMSPEQISRRVQTWALLTFFSVLRSALMLRDVVAEMTLPKVCEKYQILRGAVQGLQASASIFAGRDAPKIQANHVANQV